MFILKIFYMLFSWNLLKRYINIKDDPKQIANYLTLKTCEIEEIITRKVPEDVVIAYVTSCKKHPDADKLFVTSVDCWEKWIFQIVTWAENIKKDIYVPVALEWAYLPEKDLKIKSVKMRGLDSNGMICSKEELWIQEDLDLHGIWILDEDLNDLSKKDLWKPLSHKIPFIDNFIFDIDNKTLTNRPDLTWHLGQAIDLYAIYKVFDKQKIYMNDVSNILKQFANTNIFEIIEHSKQSDKKVFLDTPKARSYVALDIQDIKVKKSWFKERLELVDLWEQTVNNYVDFSNLFMFLTWQPVHFFDTDKIKGNITVKEAKWWEEFIDLLDKKHILNSWDIIITDDEKILALAWIIWWKSSSITEHTQNITVEIWNFDPIQIRKTWNSHDLRTNAKIRFEKNINPLYTLYSLLLFLDQFKISWLSGNITGLAFAYDKETQWQFTKKVPVDFKELKSFIWVDNLDEEKVNLILSQLWFEVFKDAVKVPYWRSPSDINIKEDVFEEIIRIYGYENISWKDLERNVDYVDYNDQTEIVRLVEQIFIENYNYTLLETYPWFDLDLISKFKELDTDRLYSLQNAISSENKYLRDNLYYNLIWVISKNFRTYDDIKILETWKVFHQDNGEELVLWACSYKKEVKNWKENNIFEFKNIIDDILKNYNLKWLIEYKKEDIEGIAHPKQSAKILLNKQEIWTVFTLHPYYHKEFKFPEKSQITLLQVNLEKLISLRSKAKTKSVQKLEYNTLEDQIVQRDLSFVISKKEDYDKVLFPVWKIKDIKDYEVFDIYDLDNKKSISLKITIKWEKMDNEYINSIMNKVIQAVEKNWWTLR